MAFVFDTQNLARELKNSWKVLVLEEWKWHRLVAMISVQVNMRINKKKIVIDILLTL